MPPSKPLKILLSNTADVGIQSIARYLAIRFSDTLAIHYVNALESAFDMLPTCLRLEWFFKELFEDSFGKNIRLYSTNTTAIFFISQTWKIRGLIIYLSSFRNWSNTSFASTILPALISANPAAICLSI